VAAQVSQRGRALVARLLTDPGRPSGSNQRAERGQGSVSDRRRCAAMRSVSEAMWQSKWQQWSGACRPTADRPEPAMRIERAERGQGASATEAAAERCGHSQEQRGNPGAEGSGACRPTAGRPGPTMRVNERCGAGPCAPAERAASPWETTPNQRSPQPQSPTSERGRRPAATVGAAPAFFRASGTMRWELATTWLPRCSRKVGRLSPDC